MEQTDELLRTLLGEYEGVDLEFKDGRGGLPSSLWSTYCAFANTDGGTLWLGISECGDSLNFHGLPDTDQSLSDFWNAVNNRSKVSRNLLTNDDVRIVTTPGDSRKFIAIDVPRAARQDRPVYVGLDPFRGTYRRNHSGDYLSTGNEVRRMFADQSDMPADSRILEGFGGDDIDADSLRQYRTLFAARNPTHPWALCEDRVFLQEVFVNALIHADYRGQGGIVVDR